MQNMLWLESLKDVGNNIVKHSYTGVLCKTWKKCVCVCVIKITISNMISAATCVTYYVYLNVLWPTFLKTLLDQVNYDQPWISHTIISMSCQGSV